MVQNKGWASLVSAAAVIPAPRVVGTIIGPKASVAGSTSLPLIHLLNSWAAEDTIELGGGRGKRYSVGRGKIR